MFIELFRKGSPQCVMALMSRKRTQPRWHTDTKKKMMTQWFFSLGITSLQLDFNTVICNWYLMDFVLQLLQLETAPLLTVLNPISTGGGCFFIPPIVNLMPFFCGVEFFFQLLMIFYVGDFNTSQCSQTFDLLLNILRNSAKKVSNPSLFWVKNQKILFFWVFSSISRNISL